MANAFQVNVPNVLQALVAGETAFTKSQDRFKQNALTEARRQAGSTLQTGGDVRGVLGQLLAAGDIQGASAVGNFGNQDFERQFRLSEARRQQGNADRTFGIQERVANRQDVPPQLRILNAAGVDPKSEEGRRALFPRADRPVTATDKKAIFEAEDSNVPLQSTIETLDRAKQLVPKAFSGFTASTRGLLGANLPDAAIPDFIADRASSEATVELNQLLSSEAIQTMANTLKGVTTNFELEEFKKNLADPRLPPEIKLRTIDRMRVLADRKKQLNDDRIQELRGGEFRRTTGQRQQSPLSAPDVEASLNNARAAIRSGKDPDFIRKKLRDSGIDPSRL